MDEENEVFRLSTMEVLSRSGQLPRASLTITTEDGSEKAVESEGDGPVDAVFKAIEKLVNSGAQLELYSVNAVTAGTDSQGEVTVRLEKAGRRSEERRVGREGR